MTAIIIIMVIITRQVPGCPVCDRGAIPEDEKLYAEQNHGGKKITKRIGWQATVQNYTAGPSSKLNLESLRVTVPEI